MRSLLLLLCGLFVAPVARGQSSDDFRARQVDSLFAHLNQGISPGIAVAVVRDGKVILRRGYGLADLEHHVPVTPTTVFDVASLAKQVTGFAIATLVADGKIALGDDIRRHVPELPDFGRVITIDHLVHHASGLRDWVGTLSVAGWRRNDAITSRDVMTMAQAQGALNFVPGTRSLYSNTGYVVLAELVQRVTGKPFAEWARANLFAPLGMTSTHLRADYAEVIPDRAFGYGRNPDGSFRATPNLLAAPGSSSLFTTVDDFAKWMINFDTGAVGGRRAVEVMRAPGKLSDGTVVRYGYGITTGTSPFNGLPFFSSNGGWASFTAFDAYFPEQRFGVVVFSNSEVVNAQQAAIQITNLYLPPTPRADSAQASPRAASPSPSDLDAFAGLYRFDSGSHVRITRFGSMLLSQVPREGNLVMSPKSEREFGVEHEDDETPVAFERTAGGRATALTYGGRRAVRADSTSLERPDLAAFAGDYDSEELGTSYRVTRKGGALQLEHRRRGTIPLTWLWGDEFSGLDYYFGSVEFERDRSGKVTGLVINGDPRSLNLRFTRRR